MSWSVTTLHTTPSSIEVSAEATDRWSIDMTAVLQGGESVSSPAIRLKRIDPPTYASIVGFVTSGPTAAGNVVTFGWTGSVLTRGETYLLECEFTASATATPVVLLTVLCVA